MHGLSVSRIDPATNTAMVVRRPVVWAIDYGEDSLWVQTGRSDATIERLVPTTNAVASRLRLDAVVASGAATHAGFSVGAGATWVDPGRRGIFKFSVDDGHLMGSVNLGRPSGTGAAFGEWAMWLLGADNTVLRVDPESTRVVKALL